MGNWFVSFLITIDMKNKNIRIKYWNKSIQIALGHFKPFCLRKIELIHDLDISALLACAKRLGLEARFAFGRCNVPGRF